MGRYPFILSDGTFVILLWIIGIVLLLKFGKKALSFIIVTVGVVFLFIYHHIRGDWDEYIERIKRDRRY